MFNFPAVVENMLLFHVPELACILDWKNSYIPYIHNKQPRLPSVFFPPVYFLSSKLVVALSEVCMWASCVPFRLPGDYKEENARNQMNPYGYVNTIGSTW